MSCMNTQMMNRQQAQYDMDEARDYAAESRAFELLEAGNHCDPYEGCNLVEAMEEAAYTAKKVLGDLIREGKYGEAGIFLKGISYTYWSAKADEQAWDELS